jgi:hypothetical protein
VTKKKPTSQPQQQTPEKKNFNNFSLRESISKKAQEAYAENENSYSHTHRHFFHSFHSDLEVQSIDEGKEYEIALLIESQIKESGISEGTDYSKSPNH